MAEPKPKPEHHPERAELPDLPSPSPPVMRDRATCSLCSAIAPCAAAAHVAVCRVCADALVHAHDEADKQEHPALRALRAAPLDDEPETDEERAAVAEAQADLTTLTTKELCAEFGIDLDVAHC